jgi:hypothetical protein
MKKLTRVFFHPKPKATQKIKLQDAVAIIKLTWHIKNKTKQ